MKRQMINATLVNVEDDSKEYWELKRQMVDDLTADELDQPANVLRALLEDYVWRMFNEMDNDALQDHYENLMEAKKDE